jgi:hypothetical protein
MILFLRWPTSNSLLYLTHLPWANPLMNIALSWPTYDPRPELTHLWSSPWAACSQWWRRMGGVPRPSWPTRSGGWWPLARGYTPPIYSRIGCSGALRRKVARDCILASTPFWRKLLCPDNGWVCNVSPKEHLKTRWNIVFMFSTDFQLFTFIHKAKQKISQFWVLIVLILFPRGLFVSFVVPILFVHFYPLFWKKEEYRLSDCKVLH